MEKNKVYELCYQTVVAKDLPFSRKWVYEWLDKIMVFGDDGRVDRRILTKFGSEIQKGQLINLYKTKNHFYED